MLTIGLEVLQNPKNSTHFGWLQFRYWVNFFPSSFWFFWLGHKLENIQIWMLKRLIRVLYILYKSWTWHLWLFTYSIEQFNFDQVFRYKDLIPNIGEISSIAYPKYYIAHAVKCHYSFIIKHYKSSIFSLHVYISKRKSKFSVLKIWWNLLCSHKLDFESLFHSAM